MPASSHTLPTPDHHRPSVAPGLPFLIVPRREGRRREREGREGREGSEGGEGGKRGREERKGRRRGREEREGGEGGRRRGREEREGGREERKKREGEWRREKGKDRLKNSSVHINWKSKYAIHTNKHTCMCNYMYIPTYCIAASFLKPVHHSLKVGG